MVKASSDKELTVIYNASQLKSFCTKIIENGESVQSRWGSISEMMFCAFDVTPNVLNACKTRKFNLGFAIAEFASLVTGYDKISLFTRHIANYGMFSTDGVRLDNSYGSRVAPHLENLIELLSKNPDARQAVLTINDTSLHLLTPSKHHPCTLTIQFLVRNGLLNMCVNMRSNDAIKGVTTDVVVFRLLQLYVANRLGLKAGLYRQSAGSLHVYDSDRALISRLPDSSKSFVLNVSLFDNVTPSDLDRFVQRLDSKSGCSGLPQGLRDLYRAAMYRWDRDNLIVDDELFGYCLERY